MPETTTERTPTALPAPLADELDLAEALAPLRLKRQAEFVRHYVVCGNASEAARRAGYSHNGIANTAYKLLKQPHVAEAVQRARAVLAKASQFDFEKASDEIRKALAFSYETGNATAAVRGAELLAKLHGHLIDRQESRVQGDVLFNFPERRAPEPKLIEGSADAG